MSIRSKVFGLVRALAASAGIDVRYTRVPRSKDLPDANLYRPLFEPWNSLEWGRKLRLHDSASLVSADRKYTLNRLLTQAARTREGDVAECGVYRGGTAYLFAELLEEVAPQKRLYLFDTFAGMPETNPMYDWHVSGDFSDTSLAGVKTYLSQFSNIDFRPGFIPSTLAGLEEKRFCFVHIDVDIYEAVADATRFFYDRTASGGVIVYDDYGFASCPGARRAVDEFFAQRPEVPLVLPTGQCIVIRA